MIKEDAKNSQLTIRTLPEWRKDLTFVEKCGMIFGYDKVYNVKLSIKNGGAK